MNTIKQVECSFSMEFTSIEVKMKDWDLVNRIESYCKGNQDVGFHHQVKVNGYPVCYDLCVKTAYERLRLKGPNINDVVFLSAVISDKNSLPARLPRDVVKYIMTLKNIFLMNFNDFKKVIDSKKNAEK